MPYKDLREFMKDLEDSFARWFNRTRFPRRRHPSGVNSGISLLLHLSDLHLLSGEAGHA